MAFKVVHTIAVPDMPIEEKIITGIGAQLVRGVFMTEDQIIQACKDADAIVCGATTQPFNRKVIENLPKCRIIANIGIGYDKLDVQAATDHTILATNVPDYCLEEVSDQAMALILALYRKLFPAAAKSAEGKWLMFPEHSKTLMPIFRLRGRTLGLLGLGRIGRAMVPKAKGFGMKVIAYDPYIPAKVATDMGVELVDKDILLAQSDYLSLHAPANPDGTPLMGAKEFKKMKPTAYLINTARGSLVDEKALIAALNAKQIAGAGLDVMHGEPPSTDNPLFKMPNVIISGHSGQLSVEATMELFRRPLQECARVLQGEWPGGLLNPQVKDKFVARFGAMK